MPPVGAGGTAELVVGPGDTAVAMGSGDLEVLATPRLVALMEQAALAAAAPSLAEGVTSVGVFIEVEHLVASFSGANVTAQASVTGVDGRSIEFAIEAHAAGRRVARGRHRRVVVDRERFLSRARRGSGE